MTTSGYFIVAPSFCSAVSSLIRVAILSDGRCYNSLAKDKTQLGPFLDAFRVQQDPNIRNDSLWDVGNQLEFCRSWLCPVYIDQTGFSLKPQGHSPRRRRDSYWRLTRLEERQEQLRIVVMQSS